MARGVEVEESEEEVERRGTCLLELRVWNEKIYGLHSDSEAISATNGGGDASL